MAQNEELLAEVKGFEKKANDVLENNSYFKKKNGKL
jgi:hypothetical protein